MMDKGWHHKLKETHQSARAEVNAEWDATSWKTWYVGGRILPERCDVSFGPIELKQVGPSGRAAVKCHAVRSILTMVCRTEKPDVSLHQVAEIARTLALPWADYIGFLNRGAYEVIIDAVTDADTGFSNAVPVNEPIFEPPRADALFQVTHEIHLDVRLLDNPSFTNALHDLTQAARFSPRTLEYCRMALEAIRRNFDPDRSMPRRQRLIDGEVRMCEALRLSRERLRYLESAAAPGRHGEPLHGMGWPIRKAAMEFAWEALRRFQLHLEGVEGSSWTIFE
jgi:hypothetical protein